MSTTVGATAEQRVILRNVSWATYQKLLADLENCSAPRLSFDRGSLEIMSPSPEHEEINRNVAAMVDVWIEELDIKARNLGSATFTREDLDRGFEPDSCFYIQSVSKIRGKRMIDLSVDPPPDLVVEIDITRSSLDKLSIFARVGVPEVWRYDGDSLRIYRLERGEYVERDESGVLPGFTCARGTRFLKDSELLDRPEWLRSVRSSVRHGT